MKALTINEIQKFKRGLDPKRAMGTGLKPIEYLNASFQSHFPELSKTKDGTFFNHFFPFNHSFPNTLAIEFNRINISYEKAQKISDWFDKNHKLVSLKDIEILTYHVRFKFEYLFEMNESLNEGITPGSIWRLACQDWLIKFIDNGGIINHGNRFISFSFDDQAGGQDNFGGREIIIEFDEKKLLKQGEDQGLGEVRYNEWWMEEHPDVCGYITGYRTIKDYADSLDPEEKPEGYTDKEWLESGWEMTLDSYEHEKEIVLKELEYEDGLIKSIIFNVPADITLINKLKRKGIPYTLKRKLKNDPQLNLFNETQHFTRGLDPKEAMDIGTYQIPSAKKLIGRKSWADASDIEKYQRWIDEAMTPGKTKGYRKYIEFCVKCGHLSPNSSSIFQDWIDKEKPKIKDVDDALQDLWPDTDESSKESLKYYAKRKLKESVNFERNLDPKEAMGTGLYDRKKMKEMMSFLHMENRKAAHKYFGSSLFDVEARVLESILWYIYFDKMNSSKAYNKACVAWKNFKNEIDYDAIKEVLKKELNIKL